VASNKIKIHCRLGYDALYSCRIIPTFQGKLLPALSQFVQSPPGENHISNKMLDDDNDDIFDDYNKIIFKDWYQIPQ
jgi:hypothetical protein